MHTRGNKARDHEADGHVHHGDDADDGSVHTAALRLVDGVAQHEIRDDDEHEDKIGGQARLPRPPHAPLETLPQIARDHGADDEHERDLHAHLRARVEALVFGGQEAHGVIARERQRAERHQGHRHMEVEDLLGQQQLVRHHLPADQLHAVDGSAVDGPGVQKRHEKAQRGEHNARQQRPRRHLVGPLPCLGQLHRFVRHWFPFLMKIAG